MAPNTSGTLFVVGTPIGHLADLSPRAREVLSGASLVAAEDTRRTRVLLANIGANVPLISYHEHNERARTPELLARLTSGASVALVSDAGMPLISDPGSRLVRAALDAGIAVVAVPGPSAVTAALSVAGLPAERFVFEGFLPRRTGARRERLDALTAEPRTMLLFESPQRLAATLEELADVLGGERPAALARELTKVHEQVYRGSLAELAARIGRDIPAKGECVIVIAGGGLEPEVAVAERVYRLLEPELPHARALALAAKITGVPRNRLYRATRLGKPQ